MSFIYLALHLAGSSPMLSADSPLLAAPTSKSFGDFGTCFVGIQEAQSRPSWLVPHDNGGRISNEGTAGVGNPYRIRFTSSARLNRVEAYVGRRGGADERTLIAAMEKCL